MNQRNGSSHFTALVALVLVLAAPPQLAAQGMGRGNQQDMATIHALLGNNTKIKRTVTKLKNGVETLTESSDPAVVAMIQAHAAAMQARLKQRRPIRQWDPLFVELFANASKITFAMEKTERGVRVVETSKDPYVVTLIQWHAEGVNGFVKEGMAGMHKEHPAPPKPGGGTANAFAGMGDGVSTCPVTGEPVSKDVSAAIQGRTVYFCCAGCVEKVRAEPAKYLKWARAEGTPPLQSMLAFDAVYIPALSWTSQAQTDPDAAVKAVASTKALAQRWPAERASLMEAFPSDSRWAAELDRVGRQIASGAKQAEAKEFAGAHEALEAVRLILMEGRKRNGLEYFVDRLTAFHEPMEAIVLAAKGKRPSQLDSRLRATLELELLHAETLWLAVDAQIPDAERYGLTPQQEARLRRAMTDETTALMTLRSALATGTPAQVLNAAVSLKPPFAKLFTTFGR
ncbi:MAG: hypothetical protein M9921_14770 [Fimbriimonadaceae bacterium]|nr:hypothetical protein [Chthonomonadaceae bacterium]MCO5298109.1 hypothetical protein [Fimbriimonadaceae bacterium]